MSEQPQRRTDERVVTVAGIGLLIGVLMWSAGFDDLGAAMTFTAGIALIAVLAGIAKR